MNQDPLSDATLVLIGHGSTRNADSGATVYQHAEALRRRGVFAGVREAFVIQEPKIATVMAGISTPRVFVVPLFISEGYFTRDVIPRELGLPDDSGLRTPVLRSGATAKGGQDSRPVYCPPVGNHPSMTGALLARAREVVEKFPFPRAPKPADITLFIAGHGTERNDGSRLAIQRQVGLIREHGHYAGVHAVFIEESPYIADCYELAQTRNVVVVPFFISDGQHTQEDIPVMLGESERIVKQRMQAGQPTWRNPSEKNGRLVWYSPAIGSEPHIADVILERVRESAF